MADSRFSRDLVRVWAAQDGSRAIFQNLPPRNGMGAPMTIEDIKTELEFQGITTGIRWDVIREALQKALTSGHPVQNVTAAEAVVDESPFFMPDQENALTRAEMVNLLEDLTIASEYCGTQGASGKPKMLRFFGKGEVLLKRSESVRAMNIFGQPIKTTAAPRPFGTGTHITAIEHDHETEYLAAEAGYLLLNSRNELDLSSPLQTNADKTALYFLLLPVNRGEELLLSQFFDSLRSNPKAAGNDSAPVREDILSRLHRQEVLKLPLRQGKPPIPAQDAALRIHVHFDAPEVNDNGQPGAYREITPYHEITKDTLIAEKRLPKEGVAGEDVFGKAIPVATPKDIPFKAGTNVREEKQEGAILYFANLSGILRLENGGVSISEEFHIHGNVGPETGNLHYSKDIMVDGDLLSGYTIDCGGTLRINGCIENGATITSKGTLIINGGIFGQKTRIIVAGDAHIRFIQESSIRVKGNLTIKDYLYNSDVFCGGDLVVEGKSVSTSDRGSVIGGRTNSFGTMSLHSVGSDTATTELLCGIDAEAYDKLSELKRLMPVLVRKVTGLQSNLGFNPSDPAAIEQLKALPIVRRQRIKERLLLLKEATRQREEVGKKIFQLTEKAFSPRLTELFVEITRHIVPKVLLRLGTLLLRLDKKEKGYRYFLKDDEILFQPAKSETR